MSDCRRARSKAAALKKLSTYSEMSAVSQEACRTCLHINKMLSGVRRQRDCKRTRATPLETVCPTAWVLTINQYHRFYVQTSQMYLRYFFFLLARSLLSFLHTPCTTQFRPFKINYELSGTLTYHSLHLHASTPDRRAWYGCTQYLCVSLFLEDSWNASIKIYFILFSEKKTFSKW